QVARRGDEAVVHVALGGEKLVEALLGVGDDRRRPQLGLLLGPLDLVASALLGLLRELRGTLLGLGDEGGGAGLGFGDRGGGALFGLLLRGGDLGVDRRAALRELGLGRR